MTRVLDTSVIANIMTTMIYAFSARPDSIWLDAQCKLCRMVLEHVREQGAQVRVYTCVLSVFVFCVESVPDGAGARARARSPGACVCVFVVVLCFVLKVAVSDGA